MNKVTLPLEIMALWPSLPPIEYPTLPAHPNKTWASMEGVRQPDQINTIIIHHMASEAPLENQASYHVNTHKWPGLSYHLVISNGRIMQTNDLLDFTYHASAHNDYSVSISIHGDLSKRELTSQERDLLYAAILTVKSVLPITRIIGHNAVNATSCPCTSVDKINQDITDLEQRLKWMQNDAKRRERAYAIANQILYMYNLAKGTDGDAEWSLNKLLELEQPLKDRGLL